MVKQTLQLLHQIKKHQLKFMKMPNIGLMQKSGLTEQHQMHTTQFKLVLSQKLREQIP